MTETHETPPPANPPDRLTKTLREIVAVVGAVILLAGAWLAYAYLRTPEAIRRPAQAHYHFRLQVINGGTPVNFATSPYQTDFNKDMCTAALTKEPAHFHDHLDQFVHIHWAHITGGILLKNYGWNFIGGTSRTLGYRFDQFPKILRVPSHSLSLPRPPAGAHYYVYVSSIVHPSDYSEQSWHDFLKLDLEAFLPTASAHEGEAHEKNTEELAALNHVLGNVVIFAQKSRPTDQQVKDRFTHLIPLPKSSCGG